MKSDKVIINVDGVSKSFIVPHEKHATLKSSIFSFYKKKNNLEFRALENISFEVKEGEFFGIIGRNGSGKSTLLKILANIYLPDKGKVKIQGRLSPFLELGVGFNPDLTARENVYLNGAILGLSRKEIDGKFGDIIEFAELKEFVDQKLKNFSSGMQVRLAFSVAIQAQAEVLLIDEVLAVGDASFQQKCFDVFRDLKKTGKTIVFVSHDMDSIRKFCDRAALIHNSRLKLIGDPDRVIYEYQRLSLDRTNQEEEKKESIQDEVGTKKVLIEKVQLLDEKDKSKLLFNAEEKIKVRIYYRNNGNLLKAHFGVGIYKPDGVYLAAMNTEFSNTPIALRKEGVVDLLISNHNLLDGNYYVNIAIFDTKRTELMHHLLLKKFSFGIKKAQKGRGAVWLDHQWKADGKTERSISLKKEEQRSSIGGRNDK